VTRFGELRSARRYCLAKWLIQRELDDSTAPVWRGKQLAEPGTALPADFPYRTTLIAKGYLTPQDIDGADTHELRVNAGLLAEQAATVIAAAARLL
jgi:hypothetical protein